MTPITRHLSELRWRLLYSGVCALSTFFICYRFHRELLYVIGRPFFLEHAKFIFVDVGEAFASALYICTLTTVLLWIPYMVYQCWSFAVPSWYRGERQRMSSCVPTIAGLLVLELALVYWVLVPTCCAFLLGFQVSSGDFPLLELNVRIHSYMALFSKVTLVAFVVFQVPVLVFLLVRWGYIQVWTLTQHRKLVFWGALLAAAALSPPDALTQGSLALALAGFYEVAIFLGCVDLAGRARSLRGADGKSKI